MSDKDIPVMPSSRTILLVMGADRSDTVTPKELAQVVMGDPFLALRLLRRTEANRSKRLGRESTTALATVMQSGLDGVLMLVDGSPLCDDTLLGLTECGLRASMASYIARNWAIGRADESPDEIALAALLAEIGELMMWYFAPEVSVAIHEELRSGRALRSIEAQKQILGFAFKTLSLALAEAWTLPALTTVLIRGVDNTRANIARIANDVARHIQLDPVNPAISADVIALKKVLPTMSVETLLAPLPISDEFRATVMREVISGIPP